MERFLSYLLTLLSVAFFLPSCGLATLSHDQVVSLDSNDLITYCGWGSERAPLREAAITEAVSRGLIRKSMSDKVTRESVVFGMQEREVLASWGKPHRVNSTNYGYSNREQWVYDYPWGVDYVYFDNGVLTATQKRD